MADAPLYVHRRDGLWFWICRGCERKSAARFRLLAINTARMHYSRCKAAQAWTCPPERVP